jgi:hypothetical protein
MANSTNSKVTHGDSTLVEIFRNRFILLTIAIITEVLLFLSAINLLPSTGSSKNKQARKLRHLLMHPYFQFVNANFPLSCLHGLIHVDKLGVHDDTCNVPDTAQSSTVSSAGCARPYVNINSETGRWFGCTVQCS